MNSVIKFHHLAFYLNRKKIPLFPRIIYILERFLFSCSIPPSVKIGKGTKFSKGVLLLFIIHPGGTIGDNCTIGSCVTLRVTLGGTSKKYDVP